MGADSRGNLTGPGEGHPGEGHPGADIVLGLVSGVWRFSALHAMIELGCADQLRDGPLTTAELAARCGAHEPSLARVLRTVASTGLIATVAPRTYALTDAGTVLVDSDWARLFVRFGGEPACWYAQGALAQTVRTGRSAFEARFGPLYDYLAAQPETGRTFGEFMTSRSRPLAARVAQLHDFSEAVTVVDVGGGNGTFLAAILRAHPRLRGVLLERTRSLPAAREFLDAQGLAGRYQLIDGDFFVAVPAGADVYLLANVLHNWADEDALRILLNIRSAIKAGGRLLLVDGLIPDDDRPHFAKDLDARMLSIFGAGGERGESEYFGLLDAAGFRAVRSGELPFELSLIEAAPYPGRDADAGPGRPGGGRHRPG